MAHATAGHYELLEKLGEGGMGVVYKARDLLLNRTAALKCLGAASSTEEGRARLLQEAQAASALNHPNIVTVYEMFQADGQDFVSMEFIPGRTLDQIIGRTPLPLDRALHYAIQIASALSAAHAAGIVHRDLKPGNIMVAEDGSAKILDFGLAKRTASAAAAGAADATRTIFAANGPHTAEGTIVGTISYMSPEQAEAKPIDHRSDIFSFGAVLYEMVTGHRAFHGESAVSTLAAILTAEPPPLTDPPAVLPRELDRIVRRCLAKTVAARWQSITDVKLELEDLQRDLISGTLGAQPSVPRRRFGWILPAAVAAVLTAGLTFAILRRTRPQPPPFEAWNIHRVTADAGLTFDPALSSDGKLLAFASDRGGDGLNIWVQAAGGEPVRLTRDLGACMGPVFTPKGDQLAFRCDSDGGPSIFTTSVVGGLPRKLVDGRMPRFSPDGKQLAYLTREPAKSIMIVRDSGGAPREIRTRKIVRGPVLWTPDGSKLLYLGSDEDKTTGPNDWFVISQDGRNEAATGVAHYVRNLGLPEGLTITPGEWLGNSVLVSVGDVESTNVYRLPLDPSSLKPVGNPVPVVVGAGIGFHSKLSAARDGTRFALTIGGNLAPNLWSIPVDIATGKASGEPVRITDSLEFRISPNSSRDGAKLVFAWSRNAAGNTEEVRIRDIANGRESRLAETENGTNPVFSNDGKLVAYNTTEHGKNILYVVRAEGGSPRRICEGCGRPQAWVFNDTKILYDKTEPGPSALGIVDAAGGQGRIIARHPKQPLYSAHVSADGRLLCFVAIPDASRRRIYVAPLSDGPEIPMSDWSPVVDQGQVDRQPVWSASGSTIYFISERDGNRCIWAVAVDPVTRKASGAPFPVHHLHQTRYSISPFSDPANIGLSVAKGHLYFSMIEQQYNVWMAELQKPKQ